ncbi:hypothetical protein [Nakamurella deserti]|uniref:hypothetical protein n=1 Tax=Nakamurella deserti TaxID=2164074 RepID=UPI000DBE7377|nr:hypothetical protein [Nakamurella deserti]
MSGLLALAFGDLLALGPRGVGAFVGRAAGFHRCRLLGGPAVGGLARCLLVGAAMRCGGLLGLGRFLRGAVGGLLACAFGLCAFGFRMFGARELFPVGGLGRFLRGAVGGLLACAFGLCAFGFRVFGARELFPVGGLGRFLRGAVGGLLAFAFGLCAFGFPVFGARELFPVGGLGRLLRAAVGGLLAFAFGLCAFGFRVLGARELFPVGGLGRLLRGAVGGLLACAFGLCAFGLRAFGARELLPVGGGLHGFLERSGRFLGPGGGVALGDRRGFRFRGSGRFGPAPLLGVGGLPCRGRAFGLLTFGGLRRRGGRRSFGGGVPLGLLARGLGGGGVGRLLGGLFLAATADQGPSPAAQATPAGAVRVVVVQRSGHGRAVLSSVRAAHRAYRPLRARPGARTGSVPGQRPQHGAEPRRSAGRRFAPVHQRRQP